MNLDQAKYMARELQRRRIVASTLETYIGDGRRIAKWDDFRYRISGFMSCPYGSLSVDRTRHWLNKLAEVGYLKKDQHRKGGASHYHLPREICDQMAAEAIAQHQAAGYSADEIRQKVESAP